ncbi:MAG: DUF4230 domain-containing protein [Prevotella sp.]|nr:DUF4230 domain-containing protein [Prevotella sp.]
MKSVHIIIYSVAAAVVVAAVWWLLFAPKHTAVELEAADNQIDATPQVVTAIRQVGQWEFLSVAQEELVDTVRRGLFSDDHLARIYYGTMRLGIDMRRCEPGWLRATGDSLTAVVPDIELLDHDFIDEARTQSFYESGRWTAADREALFRRAHSRMLARGMSRHNIETARRQADTQLRQMFAAMGYTRVGISFGL